MISATLGVSDFQYCLALPPASGRAHRLRPLPGVFKELQSALQDRLTQVPTHDPLRPQRWWQDPLGAVARQRVQARRPRRCPRKKTVTRSAWPAERKEESEQMVPTFVVVPQGAAELQGIGLTPAGRRLWRITPREPLSPARDCLDGARQPRGRLAAIPRPGARRAFD